MTALATAGAKRGAEVQRLKAAVDAADRELTRLGPGRGANGDLVPYLVLRVKDLRGERELLVRELETVQALDGDALIARFNPPVELPEAAPLTEALARGGYGPGQVIVHRDVLPDRHEGGEAAPVMPGGSFPHA